MEQAHLRKFKVLFERRKIHVIVAAIAASARTPVAMLA